MAKAIDEKENKPLVSPSFKVKPEPSEATIPFTSADDKQTINSSSNVTVKPELTDNTTCLKTETQISPAGSFVKAEPGNPASVPVATNPLAHPQQGPVAAAAPPSTLYKLVDSVEEIDYTPENAFHEGVGMIKDISSHLKNIELGSKLRKDVWIKEVDTLVKQGAPKTMIAVCGATGAGKSSLLNAVLDDNIVPTSGMRACTAVITEIAFNKKETIEADVAFLSREEWRELVDEDGSLKRTNDMRSDAGVAWQKVHAVYPLLTQEQLIRMNPDEIMDRHPAVARRLGTTKKITCPNSRRFGEEIAIFIDSKDQKRGKGKDKDKDRREKEKKKEAEPAWWPLIRLVQVRCPAKALSTGAILVDLPGVADSNAARSGIAKEYMKKCQCIFIAAPITRAVDDKTAKDLLGDAFRVQLKNGNYDASGITFIATKTDDISCSEIIRALNLEDHHELLAIEERIDQSTEEMAEFKSKKASAEKDIKILETELEQLREVIDDYRHHVECLQEGEEFVSRLKPAKNSDPKKRKGTGQDRRGSPKRQRSDFGSDDDSFIDDDDDDREDKEDQDSDNDDENSSVRDDDSQAGSNRDDDAVDDQDADADAAGEVLTQEALEAMIKEKESEIKPLRARLTTFRKARKEANEELTKFKKKIAEVQKEKNSWCSIKRNEFSRDVLKEDFRAGIKQLDQEEAQEKNPDTFDPSANLRAYDEIDLPCFTVSSRDYIRINKQVKGDGEPTCFTDKDHTGIPALQEWCHTLTVAARERSARVYLNQLATFFKSISAYVDQLEGVSLQDRLKLRDLWSSGADEDDGSDGEDYDSEAEGFDHNGHPMFRFRMPGYGVQATQPTPKVNKKVSVADAIGVAAKLNALLVPVTESSVKELKGKFRDGLEDRLSVGADKAELAAVEISDTFAASMHWATYRATLRRDGEWRRDLNAELIAPLVREISTSWSKVFESDLFGPMGNSVSSTIKSLIQQVEDTAPPGLKDRCKTQGEVSLNEAKVAMQTIMAKIKEKMQSEQKEISRCLAPHVQTSMRDCYHRAMEERGTGSVKRQKAVVHDFIEGSRDDLFTGTSDTMMQRLDAAAEAIGDTLDESLYSLSDKIEVSMSVLWEIPKDNIEQVRHRRDLVRKLDQLLALIKMWNAAGELCSAARLTSEDMEVDAGLKIDDEMDED